MNRENLEILADGLEGPLPEQVEFDMRELAVKCASTAPRDLDPYQVVPECGTVCCALGMSPLFGLRARQSESWEGYANRLYDLCPVENDWLFAGSWGYLDNTPQGAAARIRWLLEHGVPDNWENQLHGEAPLCYKPQEEASEETET